jgi:hypothetical protein
MASDHKSEYTVQNLANYSADKTVDPPLWTKGAMYWDGAAWVRQDNVLAAGTNTIGKVYVTDGTDDADVVSNSGSTDNLDGTNGLVTAAALYGRVGDTSVKPIKQDGSTHSLCTIDYEHCEVHSGSHYETRINKDMPNGGTFGIAFTTPNTTKWPHMIFAVDVELEADIILYENVTSWTGGTAITPLNSNRNSGNTSGITDMVFDPTMTLGTPITLGHSVIGSGKKVGGMGRSAEEFVLKQNTTYYFLASNQVAGSANECNFNLTWYEHTDKD